MFRLYKVSFKVKTLFLKEMFSMAFWTNWHNLWYARQAENRSRITWEGFVPVST